MPNSPGLFFKKGVGALTPADVAGLTLWYESGSNITKAFSTASFSSGREVSGTSGTNTLVSLGNVTNRLFPSCNIQINGIDNYIVSSISTAAGISTITTITNLINNYTNASIAIERVSSMGDKSTNSYNATQSTDGNKPIYIPSGTNLMPSLGFSGALQLLINSGIYSITGGSNTLFVVGKEATTPSGGGLIAISNSSSTNGMNLYFDSINGAGYDEGTFNAGPTIGIFTQTNFNILRGRRSGTTVAISLNNGTETTNTTGSNITSDQAFLGTTPDYGALIGQIQAVVIYNASLSSPNIAIVNNYLKTKYSTP